MFLRAFEGWHLLILGGLLVVLFGARKLPDSARSIGQSLRIFKSEVNAARTDGAETAAETGAAPASPGVLGERVVAPAGPEAAPSRAASGYDRG
jgi:sec-independent protein translocase protein TatA